MTHPSHHPIDVSDIHPSADIMCDLCNRKDEELDEPCPVPFPRNLLAFTATGSDYPPYLSANEIEPGKVRVTVRGEGSALGTVTASVDMPLAEWRKLIRAAR